MANTILHPSFLADSAWLANFKTDSLAFGSARFEDLILLVTYGVSVQNSDGVIEYSILPKGNSRLKLICMRQDDRGLSKAHWLKLEQIESLITSLGHRFQDIEQKIYNFNKTKVYECLKSIESISKSVRIDEHGDYIFDISIDKWAWYTSAWLDNWMILEEKRNCTHIFEYGARSLASSQGIKGRMRVDTIDLIEASWREMFGELYAGTQ